MLLFLRIAASEYIFAPFLFLMVFMDQFLYDYWFARLPCNYRYLIYSCLFIRFRKSHLPANTIWDFVFAAWYGILLMLCGYLYTYYILVG